MTLGLSGDSFLSFLDPVIGLGSGVAGAFDGEALDGDRVVFQRIAQGDASQGGVAFAGEQQLRRGHQGGGLTVAHLVDPGQGSLIALGVAQIQKLELRIGDGLAAPDVEAEEMGGLGAVADIVGVVAFVLFRMHLHLLPSQRPDVQGQTLLDLRRDGQQLRQE